MCRNNEPYLFAGLSFVKKNHKYTEFSPYNYCNNSPMMFRDQNALQSKYVRSVLGIKNRRVK